MSLNWAIAALVLNIVIWPGLGSIVVGRWVGAVQIMMMLAGIVFTFPGDWVVIIVAWLWGLVSGIIWVRDAAQQSPSETQASETG